MSSTTPSPENTLITAGQGQSIVDANGNIWTITAGGQVKVNNKVDTNTANVTHLAYDADGLVWQENANNLWWSKSAPDATWQPPFGTAAVPVTIDASQNNSVLGVPSSKAIYPGAAITDASGNTWSIVSGQVTVNGVVDKTTANVKELAYVNGRIWQENAENLWWSKTTPAGAWGAATAINPVTGAFYSANDYGDAASINVGKLTASEPAPAPGALSTITATGIQASGTQVGVSFSNGGTLIVDGNSVLTQGANLTVLGAYRAPAPDYGALVNDGTITLQGTTATTGNIAAAAHIGTLEGSGAIIATDSTLDVQTATGDTIQLHASHLNIGGQGAMVIHAGSPGGMKFLAPITMDAASTITLYDTTATREVLVEHGGAIRAVDLYSGATQVAALTVTSPTELYASVSSTTTGSITSPYVTLSTTHTTQSLPVTVHNI